MPQSSVKSITAAAIILVIACLGIGYFVTTPQWNKYSQDKAQITSLKATATQLNSALNSVQGFLTQYQALQPNVAMVNLALPAKSPNIADFMSNVGTLAQSSGILLSNFSIDSETAQAQTAPQANVITPIGFTLSVSGTFPAFKDFLMNLEGFMRIVDVDHVTMKEDQNGNINYQLHLQTYYQQ